MPKYTQDKVAGYYLYYTSHCTIECMHVHASDQHMSEAGSAKFFVRADGSSTLQRRGRLTDREIRLIQKYIQMHYLEMYAIWRTDSPNGFFGEP